MFSVLTSGDLHQRALDRLRAYVAEDGRTADEAVAAIRKFTTRFGGPDHVYLGEWHKPNGFNLDELLTLQPVGV